MVRKTLHAKLMETIRAAVIKSSTAYEAAGLTPNEWAEDAASALISLGTTILTIDQPDPRTGIAIVTTTAQKVYDA